MVLPIAWSWLYSDEKTFLDSVEADVDKTERFKQELETTRHIKKSISL